MACLQAFQFDSLDRELIDRRSFWPISSQLESRSYSGRRRWPFPLHSVRSYNNLKQRDLNRNGSCRKQSGVNWRAVRLPVISVAVIDVHLFTRECIATSLQTLGNNLQIASFAASRDLLQSTNTHDIVLYHATIKRLESVRYPLGP